ncbi:MAG TPA: hypothetical protein VFF06_30150 [Polyangia bacterium]|nr:hypothetical protein [Polyangia bacterium]
MSRVLAGGVLLGAFAVLTLFTPGARGDTSAQESAGRCPAALAKAPRVVALFPHGEGRASDHSPPVMENAAAKIIEAELERAGLKLEPRAVLLATVHEHSIERVYLPPDVAKKTHTIHESVIHDQPFAVDGVDRRAGVAYVYVGNFTYGRLRENFRELPFDGEYKRLAELIARAAAAEPNVKHLGVFYDPRPEPCEAGCAGRAEELLRAQVRDFVACLRAAHAP